MRSVVGSVSSGQTHMNRGHCLGGLTQMLTQTNYVANILLTTLGSILLTGRLCSSLYTNIHTNTPCSVTSDNKDQRRLSEEILI